MAEPEATWSGVPAGAEVGPGPRQPGCTRDAFTREGDTGGGPLLFKAFYLFTSKIIS